MEQKTHWKKCNGCQELKPVGEFQKESRAKNGYKPRCKGCTNEYYNSRYPNFKESKLSAAKRYFDENKEQLKIRAKTHDVDLANKAANNKSWRERNKEHLRVQSNEAEKLRVKNNPTYRFIKNTRKLIYRLKIEKGENTQALLGYSVSDLINKIGGVPDSNSSIDHKIPVSWFTPYTDPKIINHLDNLQILSRSENCKKHNRYADQVPDTYLTIALPYIQEKYLSHLKTA